jgi:hypothetical protein
MWFSTPTTTTWGSSNKNVAVNSITQIVCPAIFNVTSNVLSDNGLNPATALVGTSQANGCAVVTPLPNAAGYIRIAYKVFFTLSASQWAKVSAQLASEVMVQYGHILCGSTIYFQLASGKNSMTPVSSTTRPEWLGAGAAANVCYTDVFAPIH